MLSRKDFLVGVMQKKKKSIFQSLEVMTFLFRFFFLVKEKYENRVDGTFRHTIDKLYTDMHIFMYSELKRETKSLPE